MTREEAIKWMEETIQDAEGLLDKCSPALKEEVLEQNEVFKVAISALRSAPQPGNPLTLDQLREMDGQPVWISVKERLPKTGTVLVTDGKIVITAPSSSVTKDGLAITHWMPLPEPPEEG